MGSQQQEANRVEDARRAYRQLDLAAAREAHREDRIEKYLHATQSGAYVGDMVYGAIDGIITTFAVVSGVAGAQLSPGIVLILGFANLFADGLSMGVGNFLATKSQRDYEREERAREQWEVEHLPDEERQELRELYRRKGFSGEDLERAVAVLTADKKRWVHVMMTEELGIVHDDTRPIAHAAATFVAFVVAGFIPLVAHVLGYSLAFFSAHAFPLACVMTALALFWVGAARTYVTRRVWYLSGSEMLIVGGLAATAAYLVGYLLKGLGT